MVYKAHDIRLNRSVALKFLTKSKISKEEFIRFENEVKTTASLSHKNNATIHEIGEADGLQFLVYEYLPGGTLKNKILREGTLSIDEVMSVAFHSLPYQNRLENKR